jgi:hypothetical protein
MAQILDTNGYKALRGITDNSRDAQITAALKPAEHVIQRAINRDILSDPVTETRKFRYEGPIVNIDDAVKITAVKIDSAALVEDEHWIAEPYDREQPFYWLDFGPYSGRAPSPEMGFERNLDILNRRPFRWVEVTAEWGWKEIPEDLRLALALLIDEVANPTSGGSGISAKSVADTSVVYEAPEASSAPPVLPPAVQQILNPFRRIVL